MKNGHKPKLVDNLSNTSMRAVVMNSSKLNQSAKAICTKIDKTARTNNDCSHHQSPPPLTRYQWRQLILRPRNLGQQSLTVIAYQIALRQSSMTMQLRRVSPTRLGLLNNLDDWPILVDLLLSMIKSISWHELFVTMIINYLLYDTYHWSILPTCQKCWENITFKEEIIGTEADADPMTPSLARCLRASQTWGMR